MKINVFVSAYNSARHLGGIIFVNTLEAALNQLMNFHGKIF